MSVILKEAGGTIYDYQDKELLFDWTNTKKKYEIISCHPDNRNKFLSLMSDSLRV